MVWPVTRPARFDRGRAVYDPRVNTDEDAEPEAHYDRIADGYARCWGPVIRPAAERVLDLVAGRVDADAQDDRALNLLDVGTGTGVLAIRALERWPTLRVTGIDPSGAMLDLARRAARGRLPEAVTGRLATVVAPADSLPFEDASFDLAVSSFVLQLVDSRAAALREVRRVLRPGATFAWVAWQRTDRAYEPDRIANEVLEAAGFDPPEADSRPGDFASPASAAAGMRRAGFREVSATTADMAHAWDPAGYLAFFTRFDEESLFDELEPDERAEIEAKIGARLQRLTAEELTLRLPVIYVTGRAPG
jgi:SAM-dependent methyltransferase